MGNKNTVISEAQIERFRPETTASWLSEYLVSGEGVPNNIDNYLAHVQLVDVIYENFSPEKEMNFYDYHQEFVAIFRQRTWSPYMMSVFLLFKDFFEAEEWARLWVEFYRRSRQILLDQLSCRKANQLNLAHQLATCHKIAASTPGTLINMEPG